MDAAGRNRSHGCQGLAEAGRRLGDIDPDVEILSHKDAFEMPWDGLDRLESGNDRSAVDSEAPRQAAAAATALLAARVPIKGRCTDTSRSNPCNRIRVPEPSSHSSWADTSTAAPWFITGSSANATLRASRLTPPSTPHSGHPHSRPPVLTRSPGETASTWPADL